MTALLDAGDRVAGRGLEPGHREASRRVGQVEQVVRHLGLLRRRRLGRADVHAPVHLHRVDRHELDVVEAAAPPRARAPTCPTRWARRGRGGGAAATRAVTRDPRPARRGGRRDRARTPCAAPTAGRSAAPRVWRRAPTSSAYAASTSSTLKPISNAGTSAVGNAERLGHRRPFVERQPARPGVELGVRAGAMAERPGRACRCRSRARRRGRRRRGSCSRAGALEGAGAGSAHRQGDARAVPGRPGHLDQLAPQEVRGRAGDPRHAWRSCPGRGAGGAVAGREVHELVLAGAAA